MITSRLYQTTWINIIFGTMGTVEAQMGVQMGTIEAGEQRLFRAGNGETHP